MVSDSKASNEGARSLNTHPDPGRRTCQAFGRNNATTNGRAARL
ncbi:hypothetical protein FTUN_8186 [Frigoriglobus tundricola]|uniref:Uncharacterized protein n=1 Tax=Frigoriglobus tundricola TaxID=2774151 RepID=A0A6M5Z389_9BACT|nr:hypothetical protein FTUN_8186 [Frigoriglobus tundricola]